MSLDSPLAKHYELVRSRIARACARVRRDPSSVALVAVTKTASVEQICEAAALGMRDFGESRVQVFARHAGEVARKMASRPDILNQVRWHMIGHLQRNKVADAMEHASMFHSVDSPRLAQEIASQAGKRQTRARVLIQVNSGEEPQKYGVSVTDAPSLCRHVAAMPELELCGLMAMAPLTENEAVIRRTFARTRDLLNQISGEGGVGESFRELSMGMSHDFEIAIEEGATLVRIGSLLFGEAR